MADDMTRIDRIKHLLDFFGTERWRLAFGPREFGRFDLAGGIYSKNPFLGQPGKHHPDRGHVLLDGRSRA